MLRLEPERPVVMAGERLLVHWQTRHAAVLQIFDADGEAVEVDARSGEGLEPVVIRRTGVLRGIAYGATGCAELVSPPIGVFEPPSFADVPLPTLGRCPQWLGPLPEPLRLPGLSDRPAAVRRRRRRLAARELARHLAMEPVRPVAVEPGPSVQRMWPAWPGPPQPWTWLVPDEFHGGRRWWRRRERA